MGPPAIGSVLLQRVDRPVPLPSGYRQSVDGQHSAQPTRFGVGLVAHQTQVDAAAFSGIVCLVDQCGARHP